MPKYFFNLYRNGQVILDHEGVRLAGIEEAQGEATREARELIIDVLRTDRPVPLSDGIDVTDEHGLVLHTVTFEKALA
jgi:hypothetical protein